MLSLLGRGLDWFWNQFWLLYSIAMWIWAIFFQGGFVGTAAALASAALYRVERLERRLKAVATV